MTLNNNLIRKYIFYVLTMFSITLLSFFSYLSITKKSEERISKNMFVYANIYLSAIDTTEINNLINTVKDLQNTSFIKLSEQLERMWSSSKETNVRWIYTLFLKEEDFVFGPDSISIDEFGYVDPGYVYSSIQPEEKAILIDSVINKGKQIKTGPYDDEWGSWISFFVPIKDPENLKTIGILGIDIDYDIYKSLFFKDELMIIISYLFLIIIYNIIFFYIQNTNKNKIKLLNTTEQEKQKVAELENMSKLMIDRELKMIDMKNRIKELESK